MRHAPDRRTDACPRFTTRYPAAPITPRLSSSDRSSANCRPERFISFPARVTRLNSRADSAWRDRIEHCHGRELRCRDCRTARQQRAEIRPRGENPGRGQPRGQKLPDIATMARAFAPAAACPAARVAARSAERDRRRMRFAQGSQCEAQLGQLAEHRAAERAGRGVVLDLLRGRTGNSSSTARRATRCAGNQAAGSSCVRPPSIVDQAPRGREPALISPCLR